MTRALLATLLLAAATPATTFAPATTGDLVRAARRVCCVKCEEVEERLEASGLVFTHVRLSLLEDLKGSGPTTEIRLRVVGGTAGGVTTKVEGLPRFRAGEESVLLLGAANAAGFPSVAHGARGLLRMRRDEEGRPYLRERVTGLDGLGEDRRVLLSDFREAVRRAVREDGAPR
jgi:hypothetical protein